MENFSTKQAQADTCFQVAAAMCVLLLRTPAASLNMQRCQGRSVSSWRVGWVNPVVAQGGLLNPLRGHALCPMPSCMVRAKHQDLSSSPCRCTFCLCWVTGVTSLLKGGHQGLSFCSLPSFDLLGTSHCRVLFLGSRGQGYNLWWVTGYCSSHDLRGYSDPSQMASHGGLPDGHDSAQILSCPLNAIQHTCAIA